jgi:hypothetical protein
VARASTSLTARAMAPRGADLARRLVALIETPLQAQGSPATGKLIFDDGSVAALTGTFGGDMFSLSGDGYTVNASISGKSLAGSGTGPGGINVIVTSVQVPSGTVPSSPEGTYRGSYSIQAPSLRTSRSVTTGAYFLNCTYNTIISGTLEILIRSDPGSYYGHLTTTWTETEGSPGTCPFRVISSPVSPAGPSGTDYNGDLTSLVFAFDDRGTSNGAAITRLETFAGAFSGSAIVGRVSFSFSANSTEGNSQNFSGYPQTGVDVTLRR